MKKVKLKEVLKQQRDVFEIKDNEEYKQVTVSNTGEIKLRAIKKGAEIGTKKQYRIKSGWFIYSRLGVHQGAFGLVPEELDGAIVTGDMPVFEIDRKKVFPEILIMLLKQKRIKDIFEDLTRGLAQSRIREKYLLEIEIPLPDLKTQKQILSKINKVENEIKQLETNISHDKKLLTSLKQSILSEAVQGKLVKQNPKDEPASELLKKIKKEKEKLIKEGKIKKGKELPAISEDEVPYELPKGWVWCRLGEVCILRRGASPRPISKYITKSNEGVNWIKIGDTSKGSKYLTETKEKITQEGAKRSVYVTEGELIMSNSMSFGEPYILKINGCIHDGWLSFNYPKKLVNIDFLYYLLLSQKLYYESKAEGTGVRNLNINKVFQMPIPLPPLPEQKRIVEKVDALMRFCDELEVRVGENKKSSERLMSGVLREVFGNGY